MIPVRRSSALLRVLFGGWLGLLLALRLLNPAGFMPSFDQGAVTIVNCPDFNPPLLGHMGHHHHGKTKVHSTCPYASASPLGATDLGGFILAAVLLVGAALLLGRAFGYVAADRRYRRPPLRGPPVSA